jgi:nicotinamide riboside kinase
MKIVNFIAGPGAGKSTACAGLFHHMHHMKKYHYNVEYVHEHAKELTWDERYKCLQDQLAILGQQNKMFHRLREKVDWVVTDTCLLLGLFYAPDNYFKNFEPLLVEVFNSYDNINIFLERPEEYSEIGRNQNHAEAIEVDKATIDLLERLKVPYIKVDCDISPEEMLYIIENPKLFLIN